MAPMPKRYAVWKRDPQRLTLAAWQGWLLPSLDPPDADRQAEAGRGGGGSVPVVEVKPEATGQTDAVVGARVEDPAFRVWTAVTETASERAAQDRARGSGRTAPSRRDLEREPFFASLLAQGEGHRRAALAVALRRVVGKHASLRVEAHDAEDGPESPGDLDAVAGLARAAVPVRVHRSRRRQFQAAEPGGYISF